MIGNFGVTSTGFIPKRISDITSQLGSALTADFGAAFSLLSQTPEGQLVNRFSEQCADVWEALELAYNSFYPSTANGPSLDASQSMVNIFRIPATASVANGVVITGTPGVVVPSTFQLAVAGNPSAIFQLAASVTIGGSGTVLGSFVCLQTGPVAAQANSLTSIVTALPGVVSCTNPTAAQVGTNAETDSAFRLRAAQLLGFPGSGTFAGLTQAALSVPNVSAVIPQTNDTSTAGAAQVYTVTVTTAVNSTVYTISVNGTSYSITSASSGATTSSIATQLRAAITDPNVTITGSSANVIITAKNIGQFFTLSLPISQAALLSAVETTAAGLLPFSTLLVITGGIDQDIYNEIFAAKVAGIPTNGTQFATVLDSQGGGHRIGFARPFQVPVYMGVVLSVNYNPALGPVFPANGPQLMLNAMIAFGNTYVPGETVVLNQFNGAIFSVPGVLTAAITASINQQPFPPVGTSSLPMSPHEQAQFLAGNISISGF